MTLRKRGPLEGRDAHMGLLKNASPVETPSYGFFDTPFGRCAVAWGPKGVERLFLPEEGTADDVGRSIERQLGSRREEDFPTYVQEVVDQVTAHLSGSLQGMSGLKLDMSRLPGFSQRVYAELRKLRPGETVTKEELATRLGASADSRSLARAIARNPLPLLVPCHRILGTGERASSGRGDETRARILALEGVEAS